MMIHDDDALEWAPPSVVRARIHFREARYLWRMLWYVFAQ